MDRRPIGGHEFRLAVNLLSGTYTTPFFSLSFWELLYRLPRPIARKAVSLCPFFRFLARWTSSTVCAKGSRHYLEFRIIVGCRVPTPFTHREFKRPRHSAVFCLVSPVTVFCEQFIQAFRTQHHMTTAQK